MEGSTMKNAKLTALLICLLLASCASDVVHNEVEREYREQHGYGARVGLWFVDRFNDLFDVAQVDLSFGVSPTWPLINAHITEFGEVGLGYFQGTRIGWKERSVGVWHEERSEYGVGPFYYTKISRRTEAGTKFAWDQDWEYSGMAFADGGGKAAETDLLDVGGVVHLIAVGVSANFSTFEAIDFILGCEPIEFILLLTTVTSETYVDIMQDDNFSRLRAEMRKNSN